MSRPCDGESTSGAAALLAMTPKSRASWCLIFMKEDPNYAGTG